MKFHKGVYSLFFPTQNAQGFKLLHVFEMPGDKKKHNFFSQTSAFLSFKRLGIFQYLEDISLTYARDEIRRPCGATMTMPRVELSARVAPLVMLLTMIPSD